MKTPCEICGGMGQQSYFKGASRFLLSWVECPACCGTGYSSEVPQADQDNSADTVLDDAGSPGDTNA